MKRIELYTEIQPTILQAIVSSCQELEELILNSNFTTASDFLPLQELISLKTLKIRGPSCEDLNFFLALQNFVNSMKDSNRFALLTQLLKTAPITPGELSHWLNRYRQPTYKLRRIDCVMLQATRPNEFVLDEKTFYEIVTKMKMIRGRLF